MSERLSSFAIASPEVESDAMSCDNVNKVVERSFGFKISSDSRVADSDVITPLATLVNRKVVGCCPASVKSLKCGSLGCRIEVSDPVVEHERLGDRDACCAEMDDVRLLYEGVSEPGTSERLLARESGRKKDTVLDLRTAFLPTFSLSSSSVAFLTFGSVNSSFPLQSDAKYSSPRPNTT